MSDFKWLLIVLPIWIMAMDDTIRWVCYLWFYMTGAIL